MIIEKENIDCEFMRCMAYDYAADEKEFKAVGKKYEAAKKLGFNVNLLQKLNLGFPNGDSMEVPNQAKFHPTKFLYRLEKKQKQPEPNYLLTQITFHSTIPKSRIIKKADTAVMP